MPVDESSPRVEEATRPIPFGDRSLEGLLLAGTLLVVRCARRRALGPGCGQGRERIGDGFTCGAVAVAPRPAALMNAEQVEISDGDARFWVEEATAGDEAVLDPEHQRGCRKQRAAHEPTAHERLHPTHYSGETGEVLDEQPADADVPAAVARVAKPDIHRGAGRDDAQCEGTWLEVYVWCTEDRVGHVQGVELPSNGEDVLPRYPSLSPP